MSIRERHRRDEAARLRGEPVLPPDVRSKYLDED
jgi:hypothetical protein